VAGALLTSNAALPSHESCVVTLPAADHEYEVQFRQTVIGIPATVATLSNAKIRAEWP
jgi:hypothetical protein